MSFLINNHLKNGYSDYNLLFLKKYVDEIKLSDKILDVGCGHFRNLYLFYKIGFKNLYGIDRLVPDPSEKPARFKVWFLKQDINYGLPYENNEFEIVLCNYVLMFIPSERLKYAIDELLRVTKGFCIIEMQKQFKTSVNSQIEDYNFKDIVKYIETKKDFEIVDKKIGREKIIIRRIENGKRETIFKNKSNNRKR